MAQWNDTRMLTKIVASAGANMLVLRTWGVEQCDSPAEIVGGPPYSDLWFQMAFDSENNGTRQSFVCNRFIDLRKAAGAEKIDDVPEHKKKHEEGNSVEHVWLGRVKLVSTLLAVVPLISYNYSGNSDEESSIRK